MSEVKNTDVIRFSYNWNNKLSCKAFTTLRLDSPKYEAGKVYDIYLEEKGKELNYLGRAKCVDKKTMYTTSINDFIAYLDTGYNADECRKIIARMYKKDNPLMALVLLVWIKKTEQ